MLLTEENFILYAARYYTNPHRYNVKELYQDLNHIRYIQSSCKKYIDKGDLKERLIFNHIIILSNLFGIKPTVNMLLYKINYKYIKIIKPFLINLGYISGQETIQNIDLSLIESDKEIERLLND